MSATETTDLQEFVNGLREQGLSDTEIAAELDKRAATPEGQAEQAAAVEAATKAKPKPSRNKSRTANPPAKRTAAKATPKPEAKPKAKPAAKASDKPKATPKKDDGTLRIHLSDTAFKAIEASTDWRKANTRAWKAIKAAADVRAAKSIPANHYHYPTMLREDVLSLAGLLETLSTTATASRYAGLLKAQAQG